jgi:hypothetical protein
MYAHLFNRLIWLPSNGRRESCGKFLSRVATMYGKDEMIAVVQPYLQVSGPAGAEGQDCRQTPSPGASDWSRRCLETAGFFPGWADQAAIQVAAQLEDAQAASNCEACCELASLITLPSMLG